MAKQPIDVGAKITADVTGFQKAAGQVKGSAQNMKKDIKDTAGVFDELGTAIGGMGGEIASTFSNIATAASGIGAIVVIVGALAKAWQNSQENIELYLKSADKLKEGSGGFSVDAEKARVDLRKRANGMISLGYKMEKENMANLNRTLLLKNEVQAKFFAGLVKEGQLLQENGKKLRSGVMGLIDKADFQRKYIDLLKEEESLNDESLINKAKWANLDAEFMENRNKARDMNSTIEEKAQATLRAEELANILVKEKNGFIERQLTNIKEIADMTQTQEVVENKVGDLEKEKGDNLRAYGSDMMWVLRMEKQAAKEKDKQLGSMKDQLSTLKQMNTHDIKGYKFEGAKIDNLKYKAPKLKFDAPGLQKSNGLSLTEINDIIKEGEFEETLEGIRSIVGGVENAFANLFSSISAGSQGAFADMAKAFARSLQQMAAQMAAKTAIFGLLSALSGGAGIIGKFATGLLGGQKLGKFLGFAGGTNFAPGGLAMVGERGPELVNLPRGSQVIPNKSLGMGGGEVTVKFANGSLEGYMNWQSRKSNSFR